MSWAMTSIDPIDSGSRLDAGDGAVAVVGYPDGLSPTATAPGWRPTEIGSPAVSPLSMSMRLTLSSPRWRPRRRWCRHRSRPAGRRPAIGSPSSARVTGSTRVTLSERLLATQTMPPPTVTPAGPRPTGIGGAGDGGAEVDAPHGAGRGAAHPEAAGADREPQRRGVRGDPALEDPAAAGVDRGDAGAVLVGDPDPVAAEDDRAGAAADVDPALDRPVSPSMRRTSPVRGLATQTERAPTATPEMPRSRRSGLPETRPLAASIRGQGPVAGAGHPDRALAGREPQRPLADRDRRRDR